VEEAQQASVQPVKKHHSAEFIESIVSMVKIDRMTVAEVSRRSGVRANQIYRWIQKYELVQARQDPTSTQTKDRRMIELVHENQHLKKQVEFFKKAAAYFASQNVNDMSSSASMPETTK